MNTKKITNLVALSLFLVFSATAQIDTPAPSPSGSVGSRVGLTDISIEYFRPGKKGRDIFGEGSDFLVPYGQVWRTGANGGTIVTLSTTANIAGTDVEAGEYQIISKPGKSTWEVMLLTEKIGGNMGKLTEEMVAAKAILTPMTTDQSVERMTFQIANISEDNTSADIQFTWDNVVLNIPVKVAFHDVVMKDIAEKTQVSPSNYVTAANYYLEAGENLEQALEWMDMYLAMGENAGQFWNVHTKAKILAKLGKKKEAIEVAKDSMEKAKNFPSGDFGYIKRNEDLISSLK